MDKFIEIPEYMKPNKDDDFSLVEIKDDHPYCKNHGAMNKFPNGIWRCLAEYGYEIKEGNSMPTFRDRTCNACCFEMEEINCPHYEGDGYTYDVKNIEFNYCDKCNNELLIKMLEQKKIEFEAELLMIKQLRKNKEKNCTYKNCKEEATEKIPNEENNKEYLVCDFHAKFLNGELDE